MDVVNKKNRVVGVIFLSAIFVMFVLVISGHVIKKVEYYEKKNYQSIEPTWNGSEFYPFPEEEKEEVTESVTFWKQLSDKIAQLEEKIEGKVTKKFYFRMPFVLSKKMSEKAVGLDMTMSLTGGENELFSESVVVPWKEDSLGYVMKDYDISGQIALLIDFGEKMEAEGRNFLFFFVPEKCAGNDVYQDYSAEKEQEIITALIAADLDFVYVSEKMQRQGIDMASMFFKTDHHWLPSTGIWADGLLCDTLNEKYDYGLDSSIFDMEKYVTTIMPDEFLGSQGKKVTEVYADRENFPVVIPKYDTDLEVFNSKTNKISNGSIEETLLDPSVFEEPSVYIGEEYWFYGWGDQALFQIHNNRRNDGSHILVIKASFADAMYPFLAATVEELDVLDPRHFKGSIEAYINERDPETVIMVYGVSCFNEKGAEAPLFDFR